MTTAQELFERLDHPDVIDSPSYRLVWGFVKDTIGEGYRASMGDEAIVKRVIDQLDVLQASLRSVQRSFKAERAGTELARAVAQLDAEMDDIIARYGDDAYRHAVEIHFKLRRAHEEMERLPEGDEKGRTHEMIDALARRLLTDVFKLDPKAVSAVHP